MKNEAIFQHIIFYRYFWNNMSDDIKHFIQSCDACQRVNSATIKVVPELKSVEVPKKVRGMYLI